MQQAIKKTLFWNIVSAFLSLTLIVFGYYFYVTSKKFEAREIEFSAKVNDLENKLRINEDERNFLAKTLQYEQEKNLNFESQIREIAGTVGILDKLSKTDEELLQKYSKIYFLNEHYMPPKLEQIPDEFVYENRKEQYLDSRVIPFLLALLKDASEQDKRVEIISAFRSFDDQTTLKWGYSITYGAETSNQFSADQGYSEHQLGTTIDFTTPATGDAFSKFKTTEAFTWLKDNAHKYGFILSYPEKNSYYQFEPWHWRFVGKSLATRLYEEKSNFYDLDQREINQYLVKIFE